MAQYLPLLVLLVLAALFAGLSFVASNLLAPKRSTPAKIEPYESGIVPERGPSGRFPVRFYLVAMTFIIVDIEIIFLYPWAVIYRDLGAYGLWAMLIFAAGVFETFVYLIASGGLNWGPVKSPRPLARPEGMVSPGRSSRSTVRRVGAGAPGRVA